MKASSSVTLLSIFTIIVCSAIAANSQSLEKFTQCLESQVKPGISPISAVIYTTSNSSFGSVLQAYIKNLRFNTPITPKPLAIIAAKHESHVQATVVCAKSNRFQIRIRSGGHDYEGLSYTTSYYMPFVILDLFNLRSIEVDIKNGFVWAQAGATLGELYYSIADNSTVHGFSGGVCPTLGLGGHISGGGYGFLTRKYGMAVDNVIDAKIVDANGKILNRESMGEDLFWAIRGGGGASFGVILSWKLKLVSVPEKVTTFFVRRTLRQGATDLVYKWQQVAPNTDRDLFIRANPMVVNGTIVVTFLGEFLGSTEKLLSLMDQTFPELGLERQDCKEVTWLESVLVWHTDQYGTPLTALLDRPSKPTTYFKAKNDYVRQLIPKSGLESIWKFMLQTSNRGRIILFFSPYGGIMEEIPENETAFAHRGGVLFNILQYTFWKNEDESEGHVELVRELYDVMTPYVTKGREAYMNYRDIDIGKNIEGQADIFGRKYFRGNWEKLMQVKARVDPGDFFFFEQSIPRATKKVLINW